MITEHDRQIVASYERATVALACLYQAVGNLSVVKGGADASDLLRRGAKLIEEGKRQLGKIMEVEAP